MKEIEDKMGKAADKGEQEVVFGKPGYNFDRDLLAFLLKEKGLVGYFECGDLVVCIEEFYNQMEDGRKKRISSCML